MINDFLLCLGLTFKLRFCSSVVWTCNNCHVGSTGKMVDLSVSADVMGLFVFSIIGSFHLNRMKMMTRTFLM